MLKKRKKKEKKCRRLTFTFYFFTPREVYDGEYYKIQIKIFGDSFHSFNFKYLN